MNDPFLRKQLMFLSLFIGLVGAVHAMLLHNVLPELYLSTQAWTIYAFLFPTTVIAFVLIYNRYLKDETSVVKTYMLYTTLKMIVTLIYIGPWLFPKNDLTRPFLNQFFILFFIFLFLEIRILIQMLNNSSSKIEKN